jgi:hypothetical protein
MRRIEIEKGKLVLTEGVIGFFQNIASLLTTWRLQGKNGFEELEGVLRQELCLS